MSESFVIFIKKLLVLLAGVGVALPLAEMYMFLFPNTYPVQVKIFLVVISCVPSFVCALIARKL
tara:strand:+ start:1138 stop:1329 length:192 start_codon:yes stop_codon:yes gene_type:complete